MRRDIDRSRSTLARGLPLALALAALPACNQGQGPAEATPRTYLPEQGVQTVMANGTEIAYFESGSGPLVILLHGFPDTPHTWDTIAPKVAAAGFHVVTPFLRGYAPSGLPSADTTMDAMGHDVLGLVQALGEQHAILVGHDWGALSAYAAAAFDPTHVDKLVTIAIPHPIALVKHLDIPLAPHFKVLAQPDAATMVAQDDFAYVDTLIHTWSPTWVVPQGETEPVKNTFTFPGSLDAALGYYRSFAASPVPPPAVFQPLPMPALTFYGTDDDATSSVPFMDQASAFTGPFELVPLPVGHFVHREAEEAFTAKLLAFLTQ